MLLFYIRHGDPVYNPDSLTPQGELQAQALAKRLALYGLDEIYTSTSNRAIKTAEPTAKLLNITPTALDFCNEAHPWKNLTVTTEEGKNTWIFHDQRMRAALNSREGIALGERWYDHPVFAGERRFGDYIKQSNREIDEFIASHGYVHNRETHTYRAERPNWRRIALFAHQGFGMVFLSSLLDIPYSQFCFRFNFGHSSMTVIRFNGDDDAVVPCVLQLSNDSHLYREGLPTKYINSIYF